jgi:hypothetical protein
MEIISYLSRTRQRHNNELCKNYYQSEELISAKPHGKNSHGEIVRAARNKDCASDNLLKEAKKHAQQNIAYSRKLERKNRKLNKKLAVDISQ